MTEPLTDVTLAAIEARAIIADPSHAMADRQLLLGEVKRLMQVLRHSEANAEMLRMAVIENEREE